mgnify:CR=1 FL=1
MVVVFVAVVFFVEVFFVVVAFLVVVVLVVVVLSVAAAVVVTSVCAAVIVNSKRVIQVYFTHFGEFQNETDTKFKSAVQFVAAQHFYFFIIHGLCGKYTLTLY